MLLLGLAEALFFSCCTWRAAAEFSPPAGRPPHTDEATSTTPGPVGQQPSEHTHTGSFLIRPTSTRRPLSPGSTFDLKVQVNDALNPWPLSKAVVEVYVNYTRTMTVETGEDGHVMLSVPYQTGTPTSVVACRTFYVCALLSCTPDKTPIFSSWTMSLLALSPANLWLFEDSVLITSRSSDGWSKPVVQFQKSQLSLTHGADVTSVTAYVTVPKVRTEHADAPGSILGVMNSKSGYVSVEVVPLAAVSVHLFSGDTELNVSGPIQMSVPVPDSCGLQPGTVVPAWFLNHTTGGWMRRGLGTLVSADGRLLWAFTAPHLGHWTAAALSPSRGVFGPGLPVELILHHWSLLMVLLGGTLVVVISLLVALLWHRSGSIGETDLKKSDAVPLSLEKKDQNTCTSVVSLYSSSVITNPDAELGLDRTAEDPVPLDGSGSEADPSQQVTVPASLTDDLLFYDHPVAILHTFFHLEETDCDPPPWMRSATLPRSGASTGPTEPPSKDGFTQTSTPQNQAGQSQDRLEVLGNPSAEPTSRGQCSLPESASVPGTLNRLRAEHNRRSMHASAELSRTSSPRAWFVSLEGKPAAEIHYTDSEQQRRRRPVESRETSLDSGVDVTEPTQSGGRRTVTLERNRTFIKSTSSTK